MSLTWGREEKTTTKIQNKRKKPKESKTTYLSNIREKIANLLC